MTFENSRPLGFSIFYAAMIIGAIFGGPTVDWVRHDWKRTTFEYVHEN